MKIEFYGAAKEVTGSKHLISLKNGKQLLLDCGMFQGRGSESVLRNKNLGFKAKTVDYLFLSHAHIDHSGLIPYLVKEGFKGKIFSTKATYDLCRIMLADSAHIQQSEAEYVNRKREAEGKKPIRPLYSLEDVNKCWGLFETIEYKAEHKVDDDISIQFTDAGHILGSAVVNLKINDGKKTHRIAFTGDIGRYINKILKQPQVFPQASTIICESTYGDRLHQSIKEAKEKLKEIVDECCKIKGGKLIIPAFSIGKTQEMVFMLNKLGINKEGSEIKVFVDSPLAISATEIMKDHFECFGEATKNFIRRGSDPFGFDKLFYIRDAEDSKRINDLQEPCIIISASGMADAGRVKHHLANGLGDRKNTVLIIGYSDPSSLSGRLLRGDKVVNIYGEAHPVNASIESIDFFSAHADYNELIRFLSCQEKQIVEHVFLVHGDTDALESFEEELSKNGFYNITIAEPKQDYYI